MSEASPEASPASHDPFAALRYQNFVLYTGSRIFATVGMMLLQAVMAWQVNQISGSASESALNLGFLGLVRFLPALALSLVGGAAADVYNRRTIILFSQCAPLTVSLVLATATFGGWVSIPLIYGLVFFMGLAAAFEGPARQALLPAIVPPQHFANAVTIGSTTGSLGMVTGPALAGLVIATLGTGAGYSAYAMIAAASTTLLVFLKYKPLPGGTRTVSIAMIREGIVFVRHRQVLLGAMTLDMFAVIFGGAQALLPIYATRILKVGGAGYGVLFASIEAGAFLMSLILVFRRPVRDTGRVLLWAVLFFGLGTIVFGFSRSFPLSVAALMFLGAADMVSMVMRNTTIQLSTPDELRGRVSAVASVFIGASNQLGAVESGVVAAFTNATFAVVSGGIGTLAVVGTIAATMPDLRRYRILRPGAQPAPAVTPQATAAAEATPGGS